VFEIQDEDLGSMYAHSTTDPSPRLVPEEKCESAYPTNHNSRDASSSTGFPPHAFTGFPPVHEGQMKIIKAWLHWLVDSGATVHMTPFINDLHPASIKSCRVPVRIANGGIIFATHRGQVRLVVTDKNSRRRYTITLHQVLCVPDLDRRLISVDGLTDYGHRVEFHDRLASIRFNVRNPSLPQLLIRAPSRYQYNKVLETIDWDQNEIQLSDDMNRESVDVNRRMDRDELTTIQAASFVSVERQSLNAEQCFTVSEVQHAAPASTTPEDQQEAMDPPSEDSESTRHRKQRRR
jgi:hypothetical protein